MTEGSHWLVIEGSHWLVTASSSLISGMWGREGRERKESSLEAVCCQACGAVWGRWGEVGREGRGRGEGGGEVYRGEMEVVAGRGNLEPRQLEQELRHCGATCNRLFQGVDTGTYRHADWLLLS